MIKLKNIITDGGTQIREKLDNDIIDNYADDMINNVEFPPIIVFYDGKKYWLADGFHRMAASEKAGFIEIEAEVKQGTRRDAILYSVGANADHGLRRTNADKRRAVLKLLEDDEWKKWSDRKIADMCRVGNKFVSNLRNSNCVQNTDRSRKVERGGQIYEMNTKNIGGAMKNKAEQLAEDLTEVQEEINNTFNKNLKEAKNEEDKDFNKKAPTVAAAELVNPHFVNVDWVMERVNEMYSTIERRFRKLNVKQYNRAIKELIKLLKESIKNEQN